MCEQNNQSKRRPSLCCFFSNHQKIVKHARPSATPSYLSLLTIKQRSTLFHRLQHTLIVQLRIQNLRRIWTGIDYRTETEAAYTFIVFLFSSARISILHGSQIATPWSCDTDYIVIIQITGHSTRDATYTDD